MTKFAIQLAAFGIVLVGGCGAFWTLSDKFAEIRHKDDSRRQSGVLGALSGIGLAMVFASIVILSIGSIGGW